MKHAVEIDFGKLVGFDAVSQETRDGVNFQDDSFAAKLGAKVGKEPPVELPAARDASSTN